MDEEAGHKSPPPGERCRLARYGVETGMSPSQLFTPGQTLCWHWAELSLQFLGGESMAFDCVAQNNGNVPG